jgi:hypothetical protein
MRLMERPNIAPISFAADKPDLQLPISQRAPERRRASHPVSPLLVSASGYMLVTRQPYWTSLHPSHLAMFNQSRNLHRHCQSSLQNKRCLQTRQPNLTKRRNNFLAKIQSDKARRQQLPTRIQQDPRQNLPTSIRHAKIHLCRPEPNKAKEHHPTRTPLPRDLSRRS